MGEAAFGELMREIQTAREAAEPLPSLECYSPGPRGLPTEEEQQGLILRRGYALHLQSFPGRPHGSEGGGVQ